MALDPMISEKQLTFKIHGMDCAEEVAILKQVVGPVAGGEDRLAFDILNARMIVSTTADGPAEAAIVRAVASTGMRAEPWREGRTVGESTFWERRGRTTLSAASGLLLVAGFSMHVVLVGGLGDALGSEGLGVAHDVPLLVRVLHGAAIVAGSWFVAPKAWYAARRLRPDMNLLMTIAVIGAVGIGEWFEAPTP